MGFTDLSKAKTAAGGSTSVTIESPAISFGELLTANLKPVAQGDFVYGIQTPQTFTTASFLGSSVTAANGMAVLNCGTGVSGSAVLNLRRGIKYRPGQGSIMRATALFDTPVENNLQLIGLANNETGYSFGYQGTDFGILHRETGQLEIRKLTITVGATDGETVTVTLDGDAFSFDIDIDGSTSTTQTAYKLSLQDYTQLGETGFLVDVIGSDVYFISGRCNPNLTGTYSISGTNTIAGTFTRVLAGTDYTETFIPTGSFNIDKLDGTGTSEMIINPQRGNVYEIDFQYLGFGNARFAVQDPNTGRFANCHMIKNANNRTTPVLKNPNVQIRLESSNNGNTSGVSVRSASMAGFITGEVVKLDPKFAQSFAFENLNQTTYHPLAMIKTNRIHKNQSCFGEFDILRLAGSNEVSSKTLIIGFFLGAEITGDVNYQFVNDENSIVSIATLDPTTNSPANEISNLSDIVPFHEIVVGPLAGVSEDLDELEFIFPPGIPLLIAVKATNTGVNGSVSINWFEQQ
jgi:hypothetical protein